MYSIDTRRCLPAQPVVAVLQEFWGDMVKERSEAALAITPCGLTYPLETLRRRFIAILRSRCGGLLGVPTDYPPFLHALRRLIAIVRAFLRSYGDIRLLTGVDGWVTGIALSSPVHPSLRGGHR